MSPDFEDFMQAQDDLRLAFHCAGSLFHMGDWVYGAEKASIDAKFTYQDNHGSAQPVRSANRAPTECPTKVPSVILNANIRSRKSTTTAEGLHGLQHLVVT